MSERHREALAHLLYGVGGGGGFVLLTGDIGAGKTTVCRCFLEQIPPRCHVAYIFNPKLTVAELLQSICDEFHLAVQPSASGSCSVKDYIDALNAFLLQAHAQGQNNVLIIDEAQNLSADVLEQLRLLTNLETSERKLLQIVLIGQPELRTMLARPELEQLAQRVIARFHLDALSEAETAQYIQHRLAVAGHRGVPPFDAVALKRIWQRSRGVPRRINLLCDRALLGAWAHGQHQVSRSVVEQAAAEVFGPAHPAPPRAARAPYALVGAGLLAGVALTAAAVALLWPADSGSAKSATAVPLVAASGATPARTASAAASGTASAAAPASAVHPASAAASAPVLHHDLDAALLAQLPHDLNTAWQALAPAWKLAPGHGDPCEVAATQQVQCFSSGSVTLPLVRQLGRPGLITLQVGQAAPVYAELAGLDNDSATLRVGTDLHRVPLAALGRLWRGDFATYWRAPPGYNLRDSSAPSTLAWVAARLAQLDGETAPPPATDAALRGRIQAFQRTQGLKPDGLPGPMTLMQLGRATGTDEPRLLHTEPR